MHLLALLSYPYPDALSVQACAVTEAMSEPEFGGIVNFSLSEDQAIGLVFLDPNPSFWPGALSSHSDLPARFATGNKKGVTTSLISRRLWRYHGNCGRYKIVQDKT